MTIVVIIFAILLQVFLTVKKLSPFLSLLIVSIIAGLCLGMPSLSVIKSIETGIATTLGSIALVICLGATLGKILEESGAAEKIATTLISFFGEEKIQWAIMLTGFFVGIPLYYNAGFIILVPLVFMLTKKAKLPLLYVAIPMAAALSTTHCFLPPHPGPMILIATFKADVGKTLYYGIFIAIPAVVIAGPMLGKALKDIMTTSSFDNSDAKSQQVKQPSAFISFSMALLPILLVTLSVIAENLLPTNAIKEILLFIGNVNIALLISVMTAFYVLGIKQGEKIETLAQWMNNAISNIATIILIIAAGSVFKQVITDSGAGNYIAVFSSKWNMHPLIFAWLITAMLRVAIGSATVAGITAAGVVAPLIHQHHMHPELMVLAVGAGSVFGSHVNDSGFWMFKEFFKLNLKQTFLSWTAMESIISIIGLIGVLLLNMMI